MPTITRNKVAFWPRQYFAIGCHKTLVSLAHFPSRNIIQNNEKYGKKYSTVCLCNYLWKFKVFKWIFLLKTVASGDWMACCCHAWPKNAEIEIFCHKSHLTEIFPRCIGILWNGGECRPQRDEVQKLPQNIQSCMPQIRVIIMGKKYLNIFDIKSIDLKYFKKYFKLLWFLMKIFFQYYFSLCPFCPQKCSHLSVEGHLVDMK